MPSAQDNPEGFYESLELFNLNNELLASVGHRWDSPWLAAPRFEDCMSAVDSLTIQRFLKTHPVGKDSDWIDKDPRLCLTIDMVSRVIRTSLPAIGIIRNPLAASYSLRKRNGFSMDHALGLWIIYNYHAFVANSTLPLELITFEELTSADEDTARKIGDFLKSHRSVWKDPEGEANQDVVAEIIRHVNERVNKDLVHWEHDYGQGTKSQLRDAAVEMWTALTVGAKGTYAPTAEIVSKASEALGCTLSQYSRIIPSAFYTRFTSLSESWKSSVEECKELSIANQDLSAHLESSAINHGQAVSQLELRHANTISELEKSHAAAVSELEEKIHLVRSEQVYWTSLYNESATVIRELQAEVMGLHFKAESLLKKLNWYRRNSPVIRSIVKRSQHNSKILQMRIAQLLSIVK